jgi:hypothetical protein
MGPQLLTLESVNIESGVSAFDGKGFCRIEAKATNGDVMIGQLTPGEMRAMALSWVEAATAAEHDAGLLDFLLHTLELDNETAGNVLLNIRTRREGAGEEEE